jgi:hypothetical protein
MPCMMPILCYSRWQQHHCATCSSCACLPVCVFVTEHGCCTRDQLQNTDADMHATAAVLRLQYMWEAASHEIGHNMGLYHDGDQSTPYYEGHGIWAPIMVRLTCKSMHSLLILQSAMAVCRRAAEIGSGTCWEWYQSRETVRFNY